MPTATLRSRGRLTIPKDVRERLRVNTGDQIDFVLTERDVIVRGVSLDVRELKGLLKRPGRRAVSVEAMNAAILRRHKKTP
jgi:antitoxin PrlF